MVLPTITQGGFANRQCAPPTWYGETVFANRRDGNFRGQI
jgi:hypothetical protein